MNRTGFVKTCSLLLLLVVCLALRQDAPPRLQLFLLIGQSNMAGRGAVDAETPHPRIWMLTKEQTWVPAQDPLHFDKPAVVGVGPGLAFAQKVADAHAEQHIGLIPGAVGGSAIDVWEPGAYYAPTKSHPYDEAIERAKKAFENGQLAGILWHQGESDSRPDKAAVYAQKLTILIKRIRADLRAENVPVLIGTLGDFYVQKNPNARSINTILTALPATLPNVYVV
ncbi:MAG: sialate O-acetylesterase, partial [Bacteroidetes bacterium]|nr:sialate O-acetylesterase [Fibrella sp.]